MLPRNHKAVSNKTSSSQRRTKSKVAKGWAGLELKDLEDIEPKMREKFNWNHSPREFQVDAIKAQLLRKDVLVHAGTGSGKTTIAAGPHALTDPLKRMVTFVVSPLIALQEEQAKTFRNEFGLEATAINSAHEGCTNEIMSRICNGDWQIVLLSPEIMLSAKFRDNVLLNPKMASRILSVVVDEAHVISHWGAEFRKDYGRLGILRSILPNGTPFVAMSATLSRRIKNDVLKKLEFNEKDYLDLDIGNDRSNVSIVTRSIHNPMITYSDMDFVIPAGVTSATDIPLTFIYADKINDGVGIEERLTELLPENLRNQGLIRPYSAAYTVEHREMVMALFRAGIIRVLVCTDAAGMGCNIPDVDVVVQWKLPTSVSAFVQRAGRAARDPKREGLAVLLVEKSVFEADLSKVNDKDNSLATKQTGVRQSVTYPKAPKGYAIRHGIQRGSHHGNSDKNLQVAGEPPVPLDSESPDEGLYSLAQTGGCRREILTQIYGNKRPNPTAPCCDICDPTLLNRTRPSPPDVAPRKVPIKTGAVNQTVKLTLQEWRRKVWKRDFEKAMFNASVILKDETLEKLSSVGPVEGVKDLERVVGEDWPWLEKYGDELIQTMAALSIAPMEARSAPKRAPKRTLASADDNGEDDGQELVDRRKKRATEAGTSNPALITSVNHGIVGVPALPRSEPQPRVQETTAHAPYFPYYPMLPQAPTFSNHAMNPPAQMPHGTAAYYSYYTHPSYPMPPPMYSHYIQYHQQPTYTFPHMQSPPTNPETSMSMTSTIPQAEEESEPSKGIE
ncbi:hypothetical protein D9613_009530 [Agrocybe pediades]|uniref:DNA 3'-5' helicase n=1 Tax=Agrocybe pediades TaxID=84607 RepID=A0A8H4R4K9_9AGAR|nr:hypothetical protein D9613_009537 [Agrocybe pediades]KAF4622107.1 hypothetical protein D9613_009531 [Agrocybe pediades]KAF4622108.1 hypothetical protein D9613_009530 [Agrocybe pediades]